MAGSLSFCAAAVEAAIRAFLRSSVRLDEVREVPAALVQEGRPESFAGMVEECRLLSRGRRETR
jgi:hypothetical protein